VDEPPATAPSPTARRHASMTPRGRRPRRRSRERCLEQVRLALEPLRFRPRSGPVSTSLFVARHDPSRSCVWGGREHEERRSRGSVCSPRRSTTIEPRLAPGPHRAQLADRRLGAQLDVRRAAIWRSGMRTSTRGDGAAHDHDFPRARRTSRPVRGAAPPTTSTSSPR
jgi:hypothetical protein